MELELTDPVVKVPLIGPLQAGKLAKLEIKSVSDLLNHYPFRYEDFSNVKKISELVLGQTLTVTGKLTQIKNIYTKSRQNLIKAKLADETGQIDLVWFNQPYLTKTLKPERIINIAGKVNQFSGHLAFVSPEYEVVTSNQKLVTSNSVNETPKLSTLNLPEQAGYPLSTIHTGRLVPIYPETAGVSSKWLRSRIANLLRLDIKIVDFLPEAIKTDEELIDLTSALKKIHFPKNQEDIEKAQKRLAFDEIFDLQLRSQIIKKEWQGKKANFQFSIFNFQFKIEEFIRSLPFELTGDQKKVMDEVLKDLSKPQPMNRLLQGEVGSGKTVVAVVAAHATLTAGYQTVYMAPTEILANQHYQTFQQLLKNDNVEVVLITSSTRRNSKLKVENGKLKILIGTHALLYNLNQIKKVGLVVIDEQHKFGVEQRAKLLKIVSEFKDQAPHLLTMTATPIPRTLALTALAELDLSVISEMPKERKLVKTWYVPKAKRAAAYEWIKQEIKNQESQVYVVCPFIDESTVETLKSVRAAKKEFESLQSVFRPFSVALLHGKLKAAEKEAIMKGFSAGQINLLVSTPVVEVGIDNPNATIILIEAAERFGLASLHQLRGRVGRGQKQSYCLLFSEAETPGAIDRLKLLEKHHSGLNLAEMDLKTRGMGTLFSTEQSGFLKTKIADLNDFVLIQKAKNYCLDLLNQKELSPPALKEKIREVRQTIHLD